MKRLFLMAIACSLFSVGAVSHAEGVAKIDTFAIEKMAAAVVAKATKTQNVINWLVGDYQNVEVKFLLGGGAGHKEATKEEADKNAVWFVNEMTLMGQKQKTEALIDRSNGKTIKLIVNGKEEDVSKEGDGEIEIIEQSETEVTVPAGKFDCLYIKAKVKAQGQDQEIEVWINPVDVNLDGMLKVVIQSMFGPITMQLKDFGSAKK